MRLCNCAWCTVHCVQENKWLVMNLLFVVVAHCADSVVYARAFLCSPCAIATAVAGGVSDGKKSLSIFTVINYLALFIVRMYVECYAAVLWAVEGIVGLLFECSIPFCRMQVITASFSARETMVECDFLNSFTLHTIFQTSSWAWIVKSTVRKAPKKNRRRMRQQSSWFIVLGQQRTSERHLNKNADSGCGCATTENIHQI